MPTSKVDIRRGVGRGSPRPLVTLARRPHSDSEDLVPDAPSAVAAPEDMTSAVEAERTRLLSGYAPGLDGLRGAALLGVLASHMPYGSTIRPFWIPGGWLTLCSFFALSGFLITRVLIAERTKKDHTSLSGFWTRRARRLLPGLFAAIALSMAAALSGISPPDKNLPEQFITTLFYVRTTFYLHFGGINGPTMFQFWSLSVEEQFYTLCPLVFLGAVTLLGRARAWMVFAALTVSSCAYMVFQSRRSNWFIVYFSTPTRMFEILGGVMVAFAVTTPRFARLALQPRVRWASQVAGLAGVGALAFLWNQGDVNFSSFHRWVPWAVLATAAVITACLFEGPATRLLSFRPLRWVGRVSYGGYIYHLLVYFTLTPERTHIHSDWLLFVVRLAVVLTLAWVSHRFMEEPLRHNPRLVGWRLVGSFGTVAALLVVAALALPFKNAKTAESSTPSRFSSSNALATTNSLRVTAIGDELMSASLPALDRVLESDPGTYWVASHTATDCPLGVAAVTARNGRAVSSDGCRLLWFSFGSALRADKPAVVVVLGGMSNLYDQHQPDGTWAHLGEGAFDERTQQRLAALMTAFSRVGATKVVWFLPTPAAFAEAALDDPLPKNVGGVNPETAGLHDVPGPPNAAELARRATRFEQLVRAAAATHPTVHVERIAHGSQLSSDEWVEALSH